MRILIVAAVLVAAGSAMAETAAVRKTMDSERPHLVQVEAFGKLGLYSIGYEYLMKTGWSLGAAASGWSASHRLTMGAALHVGYSRPLRGRHRWFAQVGPQLVHDREPAVPGFAGLSVTGLGAHGTAGYEWRGERFLVRGFGVLTAGRGGLAPWAGSSVGLRF